MRKMLATLVVRSFALALFVALVVMGFTATAGAQTIKPRGAASAAPAKPATTTAPADKPAEAKPATAAPATGLNITGTLPAKFETGRRLTANLAVTGGKGPYTWYFDGPKNNEIVAIGRATDFYAKDKDHTANVEFVWWVPRQEGQVKGTVVVDDSSEPALHKTYDFTLTLTPINPTTVDTYTRVAKTQEDLAALADQMSKTREAGIAQLDYAKKQLRDEVRKPTSDLNVFVNAKLDKALAGVEKKVNDKVTKYTSGGFIAMVAFGIFLLVLVAVIGANMITRRFFSRTLVLFFALGLGFAAQANAQPTVKAAATCTIRSVSLGSAGPVLVKEQDPAVITIAVRNCKNVKSVEADGVTFTDFAATANSVTAKAAAEATTLTGPTSFKLTLADGTEVAPPDSLYILVLDTATAIVRKDVKADVATLRKEVAVAAEAHKGAGYTTQAYLQDRIKGLASKEEAQAVVDKALEALTRRVADLEMVTSALVDDVKVNALKTNLLTRATADLANGQAVLAETQVKKGGFLGFGGMKPLNENVAAAAERIKQAVIK